MGCLCDVQIEAINVKHNNKQLSGSDTDSTQHTYSEKYYNEQIIDDGSESTIIKQEEYIDCQPDFINCLTNISKFKQKSYLTVSGFIREFFSQSELSHIIPPPTDVLLICVSYYHSYSVVTSFDENYYDSNKWKLSKDHKTVLGISDYLDKLFECQRQQEGLGICQEHQPLSNHYRYYTVYLSTNNSKGYQNSMHYAAIKTSSDHISARCAIGVICSIDRYSISVGNTCHYFLSSFASYLLLGGESNRGQRYKPEWKEKEIIIIKLDLNASMVYYYKTKYPCSSFTTTSETTNLIKAESIKKNESYYFAIVAEPSAPRSYSLVDCCINLP